MNTKHLFMALAACVCTALPSVAMAQEKPAEANTLTVLGAGTVVAVPDTATLRAGVVSVAFSAAQGLGENDKIMKRVIKILRRYGIPAADIETHAFSVRPEYAPRNTKSNFAQRIKSYRISNEITVKTHKTGGLGGLIDVLVQDGINRIDGISFSIRDRESRMDSARRKAVADARRKAVLYAGEAGVTLGRVLRLSETDARVIPRRQRVGIARVSSDVSIEPGTVEITAHIRVTYELK